MSSPRSSSRWPSFDSKITLESGISTQFDVLDLDEKDIEALDPTVFNVRVRRLSRPTLPSILPSETPCQRWKRGKGFWRSFFAICLPLLLSALEGSVTNTALPTISEALDLGKSFAWVATAFLLASTVLQPLYSQLGDIWGRKYPMMFAVCIFAVGSAICGGAQSGAILILGRIVQGLGTGGIDLFAEMILCDIVPLRMRGPYLAIKHGTFAVGTVIGPVLGGVFAEHGWRWCFLINVPICAISLVVMWFWLHVGGGVKARDATLREEMSKVDYIGSGILTVSVILLLVALSAGGAPKPWSHPAIIIPLAFGFVGLLGFTFWERSTYCKYPIMPPHVFSNRTTNIAFTLTTIHGFVTYGFQFFLPPFFQAVKGSSPTQSGLEVSPTTLTIVLMAAIGGPLLTKWGKYKPIHIIGFAALTLGLGLCNLLGPDTSIPAWLSFQFVTAFGLGLVVSTMLPAVQVKLSESLTAASAGSWAFLRGTGSLFGVAIPGAIFNTRFDQLLPEVTSAKARAQLRNGQAYQRASAKFVQSFDPVTRDQIIRTFTEALKSVWIVFGVVAAAGFLLTWFEKQYKMREDLNTEYGLKPLNSASTLKAATSGAASAITPAPTMPNSACATPAIEHRDSMDPEVDFLMV